ncbi:MAG TPA: GGDEF domain-containing protein [Streptosporangiaceae bacterium]|nr:GGDEF domain-containing protein [Streptosporangiaceae bacterium]
MRVGVCKRLHASIRAARAWPIWELPRWLIVFILAVATACAAAIGLAATTAQFSLRDVLLFGALLACVASTVELTRRAGESAGVNKDVYAVWELPIAVLLPPLYALLAPLIRFALIQCRIRRVPLHRRVFSAAAVALSFGAASLFFHLVAQRLTGQMLDVRVHGSVLLLIVAATAALQWAVNSTLVLPAIKASDPAVRIRDLLFARERVQNDVVELCVAVLVVLGIALTPLTIVFSLPFVTLLQRSVRHAQLVNASRIDSKTGLLNAGTWEQEAASEVARAVRTRTPLALVLIDVDHFKLVNDLHGHLAGDRALRAIAHTFQLFLRDYDLAGRFGGEEFALLLPQTNAADARQIAERVRRHIAAMPIGVGDDPATEPLQVTVSIGVAALGVTWERVTGSQLTDLLAGADGALYRAKHAGRNQVWMVTDTATVGAVGHRAELSDVSVHRQ